MQIWLQARLIRGNPDSPLTAPLREILTIVNGPVVLLAQSSRASTGPSRPSSTARFAARLRGVDGPAPNDIDVMVVGTPDVDEIYEARTRVEAAVHRPVNPTILGAEEFAAESGSLDIVRSGSIVPVMGEQSWRSLR